jgi:predicted nucleic acid-binding protein
MAVIDASALAGWLLPDEDGPDLSEFLAGDQVEAQWLLWVDLRNILVMIERRGRIEVDETTEILSAVDGLGISLDTTADSRRVMALARRHGLTPTTAHTWNSPSAAARPSPASTKHCSPRQRRRTSRFCRARRRRCIHRKGGLSDRRSRLAAQRRWRGWMRSFTAGASQEAEFSEAAVHSTYT